MTELQIHIEGGDLLQQESIRSTVREIYGAVGTSDGRVAERYYPPSALAWLPDETVRSALGVGNPVSFADLRRGEDVVDLGSGGGIDCLLAARMVGPDGSVVGVDFLPDMVARGERAASEDASEGEASSSQETVTLLPDEWRFEMAVLIVLMAAALAYGLLVTLYPPHGGRASRNPP